VAEFKPVTNGSHIKLRGSTEALTGEPYWWDAAPPLTRKGPIPSAVDALVIGSGFTGLSAALTLARGGQSVLVCEAQEIGHGASTRNGGQISAKLRRGLDSIASEHGEDVAIDAWNTAKAARAYIEFLIDREKIDCDFRNCARFYGAHRVKDYDKLARTVETLKRKVGLKLESVPKSEQHRYVQTDAYHGGLVDSETAGFHPAKFISRLCGRVEQAGAIVRSHTKVEEYKRTATGFAVVTARGTINAKKIVLGTNGYTGREFPYFARRIIPIGSYIITTEPLGEKAVAELMPGCELIIDTRRAASYMRMTPDRTRIMYGGRVAATEIGPFKSAPRLKAVLDNIFPSLRGVGVTHSWMGFTGFSFDELPHLGHQDGVHYAMGYCGTGTAMATYLGHRIGLRILGQNEAPNALERLELKTSSLYRGNPWFLSTLIAGYRLLDKFHL
jgi:glycine/D-amino acid oxidase-like deaminating enzyme